MRTIILILLLISIGGYSYADSYNEIAEEAVERAKAFLASPTGKKLQSAAKNSTNIANKRLTEDPAAKIGFNTVKSKAKIQLDQEKDDSSIHFDSEYVLIISDSIPMSTLREYAKQAENLAQKKTLIKMVLRGGINGLSRIKPTLDFFYSISVKNPAAGLQESNMRSIDLSIDPEATEDAQAVPALKDQNGCIVYGDAPLEYLMQKLQDKACNESFGKTWDFAEKDARLEIQEKMASVDLNAIQEAQREKLQNSLRHLPFENALPPAIQNRTERIVPWYELEMDVYHPETGEILYPKGYRFNPLEYVPDVPVQMVLINGNRKAEVEWIKKARASGVIRQDTMIRVFGGDYYALNEELGEPVFLGGDILEKGWCHASPCIIEKEGTELIIKEININAQGEANED